jgi:UDP-glucose 4-epimerase
VIHLAACQPANISKKDSDPINYFDVNVQGTINILEYCRSNGINKVIYGTSHRNTQGLWGDSKAISEDDGICIKYNTRYTLFSISETAAQNLMEYYYTEYGINTVTFR